MNDHENQTDSEKIQVQLELEKVNQKNTSLKERVRSLVISNHRQSLKLKIAREETEGICAGCDKHTTGCDDSCPLHTVAAILL